jgi:hypothetical protein
MEISMKNLQRKFGMALLATLLLTSAASAELTITSVTPAIGPTSGGTIVTIKGTGFSTCDICSPALPNGVSFGSVFTLTSQLIDSTTLIVTAPPHVPGTFDVTVHGVMSEETATLPNAFTYSGTANEAGERVLLPILVPPVLGAYGSEFRTDFRIHNRYDLQIGLAGLIPGCVLPVCPQDPSWFPIDGRQEVILDYWSLPGTPGRFIYLPSDRAGDLSLQLRVYDTSRDATNFGTQIPVVHEDEMRSDRIALLGVPADPHFRNTLRIYADYDTRFRVRIQGGGIDEQHFVVVQGADNLYRPAYAEFTDFPGSADPLRVTITHDPLFMTPPRPEPAFWAFVSVTNNDTQHITLISPQR